MAILGACGFVSGKVPHAEAMSPACGFARLDTWRDVAAGAHRGERRDAIENRRRILASACALFAEHGIEAVGMHRIALAAGVGQGTLYRRFANKALLCHALAEDNMRRFHDATLAGLEAGRTTRATLDQVLWFLSELLSFSEANGSLLRAMADSACGVSRGERCQHPWHLWLCETVAALLREAVRGGEIEPIDVEVMTDLLLAACDPNLYLYQRSERGFSQERVVASLRQILAGLGAR